MPFEAGWVPTRRSVLHDADRHATFASEAQASRAQKVLDHGDDFRIVVADIPNGLNQLEQRDLLRGTPRHGSEPARNC